MSRRSRRFRIENNQEEEQVIFLVWFDSWFDFCILICEFVQVMLNVMKVESKQFFRMIRMLVAGKLLL